MKKGQVTIFIIIVLLIVGAIAGYFLLTGEKKSEERRVYSPDVGGVKEMIQDCAETAGSNGILFLGSYGGYAVQPKNVNEFGIPYYYMNKVNTMPTKEEIAEEFSKIIESELAKCLENPEGFEELEINSETPEVNIQIDNEKIYVNFEFPVAVNKRGDESISIIEDYNEIEIPVRLGIIYDSIDEFVDEQISVAEEEVCLSCAFRIAEENDLYFESGNGDSGETIFIITDESSIINENKFVFVFAGK